MARSRQTLYVLFVAATLCMVIPLIEDCTSDANTETTIECSYSDCILTLNGTAPSDVVYAYVMSTDGSFTSPYSYFTVNGGTYSGTIYLGDVPSGDYKVIVFNNECKIEKSFKVIQSNDYNGWIYNILDGKAVIIKYIGTEKTITVPENINGLPVELSGGLYNETSGGPVTLSENVKSLTVPASVKIQMNSLSDNETLEKVVMEGGTSIPSSCFAGCIGLTEVSIPETVERLGMNAFKGCISLRNLDLPSSLNEISKNAFYGMPIESIELKDNVNSIAAGAFDGCNSLMKIVVTESNQTYASHESGMVLNKEMKKIMFVPWGIRSLTIPSTICEIGEYAFSGSPISYVKYSGNGLVIGNNAFNGCNAIREIVLECKDSIVLGSYSFYNCSIKNMIIKSNTMDFKENVMDSYTSLTLIFDGDVRKLSVADSGSFYDKDKKATLTVHNVKELSSGNGRFNFANYSVLNYSGDADLPVKDIYDWSGVDFYTLAGSANVFPHEVSGYYKLNEDYSIEHTAAFIEGFGIYFESELDGISIGSISGIENNLNVKLDNSTALSESDLDVWFNDILVKPESGTYKVPLTSDVKIKVCEHIGKKFVTVTFKSDGKDVMKLKHMSERTITEDSMPVVIKDKFTFDCWTLNGNPYQQDVILEDSVLVAKWKENSQFNAYISVSHGTVKTISGEFVTDKCPLSSGMELEYIPDTGYELTSWSVKDSSGKDVKSVTSAGNMIRYDGDANNDVYISVNERNFSLSSGLTGIISGDTPDVNDDVVLKWSFRSDKTSADHAVWDMPSMPLVVGDYVYTFVGEDFHKINIKTGICEKTVTVPKQSAYYHQIGYGDGIILQYTSGKAYDLDLNTLWELPKVDGNQLSAAYFYEDNFYGLTRNSEKQQILIKFNTNGQLDKSEVWSGGIPVSWWGTYGITSSPVFLDDKIYFLGSVDQNNPTTSIQSIDLKKGTYTPLRLPSIDGYFLDDGWLTTDGNRLYVTAYLGGIFKEADGCSKLLSIGKDLSKNDVITIDLGYKGISSAFLVNENRGYVFVCNNNMYDGRLLVFDLSKKLTSDSIPIYEEKSEGSHGSIVLNDMGSKTYVYLVTYGNSSLVVFEDWAGKTEPSGSNMTYLNGSYGSQGVRCGPDGELIWYSDSGAVVCAVSSENRMYNYFINFEDEAKWVSGFGKNAYDAFRKAMDDAGFVVSDNSGMINSIDGVSGWTMFMSKTGDGSWNKTVTLKNELCDSFGYYVITTENQIPDHDWYFEGRDGIPVKYRLCSDPSVISSETCLFTESSKCITHIVSVADSSTEFGYISIDTCITTVGENICFSVNPVEGYAVKSVNYTFNGGTEPILFADSQYCFTMPDYDVEISVVYNKNVPVYKLTEKSRNDTGTDIVFEIEIENTSEESLDTVYLLIVTKYDDGKFLNVCGKIAMDGKKSLQHVSAGASGLTAVDILVLDSIPTGMYDNYGEYKWCAA